MAVQIQIRRGTAANWTSANPTLAEGELGYETDTGKLKAGDGSTAWTGLSYVSGTGAISDIVNDTTPQLGGDLDVNGNDIVSTSNGNVGVAPDGTGFLEVKGNTNPGSIRLNCESNSHGVTIKSPPHSAGATYSLTLPTADGSNGQVLKTDGSGTLSFGDASTVATTLNLTDTPGSYGTAGEVLALNSSANGYDFVANVASGAVDCVTQTDVNEGSITDVVALTNAQYGDITGGADSNTLYVITDGTTSIGDSDDVTITGTPSDHSFLVYDSATSDFINRTAAEAQTDLGISAFGTTLIDDADAATARATLGANDASNLSTGTLPAARLPAITDSYVGHIETPADDTYYLDPKVAAAREITGVHFAWTAGGSPDGDIDVQIGGTSVLTATGRMNSGTTFNGTIKTDGTEDVAADAVITVVLGGTNGVADITDLRFAVEYTQ